MVTKISSTNLICRGVVAQAQSSWLQPVQTNTSLTTVGHQPYDNYRTGYSNPKYKSIIKNHGDATTTMSGDMVRRLGYSEYQGSAGYFTAPGDGSQWFKYAENISGTNGAYNSIPYPVAGTSISKADSLAIIKVLENVRQQRTQFEGLTALGELRETIHGLKHPFQGARTLIDSYFKTLNKAKPKKASGTIGGRVRAVNKFLTTASDTWLEVSFGLKPLISDAKGFAEALARKDHDSRRSVVYGQGEDSAALEVSDYAPTGNYMAVYSTGLTTTKQTVRYKAYLDYTRSADFGSAQRILELNGITAEQFLPTLWELVPWSFLVDYFTNIGDVIAAGCTSQSDIKFVVRTDRLYTERVYQHACGRQKFYVPSSDDWTNPGTVGSSIVSRTSVSRYSTGALPLPSVILSLPGKTNQWINMAALWKSNERSLTNRFKF